MQRDYEAWLGFMAERTNAPHRYGRKRNDCVSFAAGAVKALTGRDPLGDLTWKTKREALALIRKLGGLEKATDARLRRIAPAMAMRGDIAGVADDELGVRLMVVEGATLAGPGDAGLVHIPRGQMISAWSVEPQESPDG